MLLVNLWERMGHLYGYKWTGFFGDSAVSDDGNLTDAAITWGSGLAGLTGQQIADGLHACLDREDKWPPSLPEFKQLCKGPKKNGLGLYYTPQYYRHQEKRPERLLEPSDELKQARRDAAAKGIRAMREKLMTSNPQKRDEMTLFKPMPSDERDFRLMVLLHMLRADHPIVRRLKVVRGYV